MSGQQATVFTGAALFDGQVMHHDRALLVAGDRVQALLPMAEAETLAEEGAALIRLVGGVIAPGFVDLQVNGGDGLMLGDAASVEGIARICAAHTRAGSTAIMPTLITDTPARTRAVIAAGQAAAQAGVPGFLGLHLEGPHLDPRRHGAHDPALIRPMEPADCAALVAAAETLPHLMLTLAPEAVRPERIAALVAAGAVVSLGHSDCSAASARTAFAAGARAVTHLFNAMRGLGHREPGLVGAALDAPQVHAGLIADGVHVAPEVLRIAIAAKRGGAGRLFLVTDAMACAGTDLAEFSLGQRRIRRVSERLELADGTLAGADIDIPAALRVVTGAVVGLPLAEALAMATSVPAACLGLADGTGYLRPGGPADFVHLDDGLFLQAVWQAGRRV